MCGECCLSMGECIAIERQLGPFTFACESVSTGTPFMAVVDGDKRDLFLDGSWQWEHPSACPFLRPREEHVLCTIHETSPAQCRFYRCVVMRIHDRSGAFIGRVTGTLALHSGDPVLREIWESALGAVPEWSEDLEGLLQRVLETHGYRVEGSGEP